MRNKMKNIVKVWRSSTAFLLSAFSFLILITSCSNDIDDTLQPAGNGTLQFVVGDFPAFGESGLTRAIGTQDEGKTAWAGGDKILVHLYSQKYGDHAVTLTFENGEWKSDGGTLSYLENETLTITAVYAPDCEIKSDKTIGLLEGKKYGEAEYIPAKTTISGNTLDISFESGRTYSRLRIAGLANQTLTVTTTDFTPVGPEGSTAPESYTLTTDEKGNAYLYGTFAEGATVNVKKGDVTLTDYTFTFTTELIQSYALDARPVIDGTLGGKAEATEDDITALMEQLKAYVDNGITTIIVTGDSPAMYDSVMGTIPAYAEALYLLADGNNQSPYFGTIDLILPDATEIVDHAFDNAFALKSITLPKVTTVGDGAFFGCTYLRTMTFGSVVTTIIQSERVVFYYVGEEVGGCDLVLNCGQMNSTYIPDLTANTWYDDNNKYFKSITLTHTGACDECKANQ